jgi:hypothetical protein
MGFTSFNPSYGFVPPILRDWADGIYVAAQNGSGQTLGIQ